MRHVVVAGVFGAVFGVASCEPCDILRFVITDCGNDFGVCESDDDCDDGTVCDIVGSDESGVCIFADNGVSG